MSTTEQKVYHVNIDSAGRVVLPADLRGRLNLTPGEKLVLEPDQSGFRATPLSRVIKEVQEYFCSLKRPGESLVDELLRERREEAAREEHE